MTQGDALPQEKARELALRALETPERGEKIRLAEEALAGLAPKIALDSGLQTLN